MANLKNKLNEIGLGTIAGGGLATDNGMRMSDPNMANTYYGGQSNASGTAGGMDSFNNNLNMYSDWINGKGPYGVSGRDHTWALSTIAIINPMLAFAIVGTMGAGAVIHGIATSSYMRARTAQKRLNRIYQGVMGVGYKLENFGGVFGFMKKTGERIGVEQFYKRVQKDIDELSDSIQKNNLDIKGLGLLNGKIPREKESASEMILSKSYVKFHIPKNALDAANAEMDSLKKDPSSYARYLINKSSKGTEKTFNDIITESATKTVNAPLYNQKKEYFELIKNAGDDVIKDYEIKMAYSIKKGGNRSTASKNRLKMLWEKYLNEISSKLDEKLMDIISNEKNQKVAKNIDMLYSYKSDYGFSASNIEKYNVFEDDLYMLECNFSNGKGSMPVLLKVAADSDFKSATVVVCNSNMSGNPIFFNVSPNLLKNDKRFVKMAETKRSSIGNNASNRIYHMNYGHNTMDSYVIIEEDTSTHIRYRYMNVGMPSINWYPIQRVMTNSSDFKNRILGEIVPAYMLKESVSDSIDMSNKLFESEEVNEVELFGSGFGFKKTKKNGSKNKEDEVDTNNKEDEVEENETMSYEEICKYISDNIESTVFVNKGVYMFISKKGGKRIVRTGEPMRGVVDIVGDSPMSYKEWASMDPYELPEMEREIDKRGDILDMDMAIDTNSTPGTYGEFGNIYLDGRYSDIVQFILNKHEKVLKGYYVEKSNNGRNFKLKSMADSGSSNTSSISDFTNFRMYIVDKLRKTKFPEIKPSVEDAKESYKILFNNLLNESYGFRKYRDFVNGYKPINEADENKSDNKEVKTENDSGEFNENVRSYMERMMSMLLEISKEHGVHYNIVAQNGSTVVINGNAENGETDGSNGEDENATPKKTVKKVKKQTSDDSSIVNPSPAVEDKDVKDIPEFIPTICSEIKKYIDSFHDIAEKSRARGAVESAPSIGAVNKKKFEELSSNTEKSKIEKKEKNDEPKLDETFKHKDDEIVVKIDNIEKKEKGEKTYTISSDDNVVTIKGTANDLENCNFRVVTEKNSDESMAAAEAKCGFDTDSYYIIDKDELEKILKNKTNESLEEYYDIARRVFEGTYEGIYEEEESDIDEIRNPYLVYVIVKGDEVKFSHINLNEKITDVIKLGKDMRKYEKDMYKYLKNLAESDSAIKLKSDDVKGMHRIPVYNISEISSSSDYSLELKKYYKVTDEEYYNNVISSLISDKTKVTKDSPIMFLEEKSSKWVKVQLGTDENSVVVIPFGFINPLAFEEYKMSDIKFENDKNYIAKKDYFTKMEGEGKDIVDADVLKDASCEYVGVILDGEPNKETFEIPLKYIGKISDEGKVEIPENKISFVVRYFDINFDNFEETNKFADNDASSNNDNNIKYENLKNGMYIVFPERYLGDASIFVEIDAKKESNESFIMKRINDLYRSIYEADEEQPNNDKTVVARILQNSDTFIFVLENGRKYKLVSPDTFNNIENVRLAEDDEKFDNEEKGSKVAKNVENGFLKVSKPQITDEEIEKLKKLSQYAETLKKMNIDGNKLIEYAKVAAPEYNFEVDVKNRIPVDFKQQNDIIGTIYSYANGILDKLNVNLKSGTIVDAEYYDEDTIVLLYNIKFIEQNGDIITLEDENGNKFNANVRDISLYNDKEPENESVAYAKYLLYGSPINEAVVTDKIANGLLYTLVGENKSIYELFEKIITYISKGQIKNGDGSVTTINGNVINREIENGTLKADSSVVTK